jgi:hypothetical protein
MNDQALKFIISKAENIKALVLIRTMYGQYASPATGNFMKTHSGE